MKYLLSFIGILCGGFVLTGCSVIDDDLSACESDFHVSYEVKLRTNITTQIETVLRSRFETNVANLLEDSLKAIFREYAHDVDLSFYVDNERRFHDSKLMEANQATYELELPADNYRHLALANIAEEDEVVITHSDWAPRSFLEQVAGDTIDGHKTGLFSARQNMNVQGTTDQTFDVTLYMVNSASILVLRTDNASYRDCRVFSSDFADGFLVNDSVYTFGNNPTVRDLHVTKPPKDREIFYAVTFPSHDTLEEAQARTRADGSLTEDPAEEHIWRKFVYVTLPDGSVTRTVINVKQSLNAGQVFIIYAYMTPNGEVYSSNMEVSTSVTLNWKPGLEFETSK